MECMDAPLTPQEQPQRSSAELNEASEAVPSGAVVVGIDGSGPSKAAFAWAVAAARRSGRPLHIVFSHDVPPGIVGPDGAVAYPDLLDGDDEPRVVDAALQSAVQIAPDLNVTTSRPWGRASQHLVEASKRAWMVVVGNRGMGRVAATVLGTTSLQTVLHARCPVVVVREGQGERALSADALQVTVGVDGSRDSVAAVSFALEAAGASGSVHAVMAWWLEVIDGVVVTTPESPQWSKLASRLDQTLAAAVGDGAQRHPDVTIRTDALRGKPAEVLHQTSQDADLLVVGSRGRGGFAGLLLGSVSQHMVTSSPCPVAVMPAGS